MIDKNLLLKECLKYDIKLKDYMLNSLDIFLKMLIDWNKKFNLTAIVDPKQMVYKHLIDSLLILKSINLNKNSNLADVGAGAGFPSTPISIVRKDLQITQIDSLKKRVNFLQNVANCLNLNIDAIHDRAEELGKKDKYRERFEYVTARAVAPLQKLVEYCLPLVKIGGFFIAMKGLEYKNELEVANNAINILGGNIENIKNFKLPDSSTRNIILIKKISHTPTKYPRNYGKISKKPI